MVNESEVLGGGGGSVLLAGARYRVSEPVRRIARRMLADLTPILADIPRDANGDPDFSGLSDAEQVRILVRVDDFLIQHLPDLTPDPQKCRNAIDNSAPAEATQAFGLLAQMVTAPFVNSVPKPIGTAQGNPNQ